MQGPSTQPTETKKKNLHKHLKNHTILKEIPMGSLTSNLSDTANKHLLHAERHALHIARTIFNPDHPKRYH